LGGPAKLSLFARKRLHWLTALSRQKNLASPPQIGIVEFMNADLAEIIKTYATSSETELVKVLAAKSKQNITAILTDLLTLYFNDKNSSTLREYVIVDLSGFTPSERKIGYNGYKQTNIDGAISEFCEAKPTNINTNDEKEKQSKGKPVKKLNGGGNFTDYTFKRLEKDIEENPLMIIGGFIDGRLIHIFRFPFNSRPFTDNLRAKLIKRFPEGKDIYGEYLRNAKFSFKDYRDIKELSIEVFVARDELANYKEFMTQQLYSKLKEASND